MLVEDQEQWLILFGGALYIRDDPLFLYHDFHGTQLELGISLHFKDTPFEYHLQSF